MAGFVGGEGIVRHNNVHMTYMFVAKFFATNMEFMGVGEASEMNERCMYGNCWKRRIEYRGATMRSVMELGKVEQEVMCGAVTGHTHPDYYLGP